MTYSVVHHQEEIILTSCLGSSHVVLSISGCHAALLGSKSSKDVLWSTILTPLSMGIVVSR